MFNLNQVITCENSFPADFTDVAIEPWGKLYYSRENSISHDSNHALILDLACDLDRAFAAIIAFYQGLGIEPRINPAFRENEAEILKPFFAKYGFAFQEYDNVYMALEELPSPVAHPGLVIRRVRALTPGIIELIRSENEGDWTVNTLRRHLASERLHLLVGFAGERPVTMGDVNLMDGLSRVDHVITHKQERGKGYCRALINHLAHYHAGISRNTLYLWAVNPVAIRVYHEAGFKDLQQQPYCWAAWREPLAP